MRSPAAQITLIEDIVIRYANVLFEGANTRSLKSLVGRSVYLYNMGIDDVLLINDQFRTFVIPKIETSNTIWGSSVLGIGAFKASAADHRPALAHCPAYGRHDGQALSNEGHDENIF